VLIMAPGLDTAMVLRSALLNGGRHGAATAVGVAIGCLCWGSAAALGLSALLQAWPLAFLTLQWGGAAYLFWLGGLLLFRPRQVITSTCIAASPPPGYGLSLFGGFSTNIMNPKVGIFYVTLLPQFVPRATIGSNYALLLACGAAAIALVWFAVLANVVSTIGPWLRHPTVAQTLDRVTGEIFIILGFQLIHIANL
jgi:threonine/homoserine/homoserine lactone efflux protein